MEYLILTAGLESGYSFVYRPKAGRARITTCSHPTW